MNWNEDPGWRAAIRPWWGLVVPWFPLLRSKRHPDLIGPRRTHLHVAIALVHVCLGVQWTFEHRTRPLLPVAWLVAAIVVAWSVGALLCARRTPPPPDEIPPPEVLADQFRAVPMILLGLAAAPALWGIAGSIIAERRELSWMGTIVGLLLLGWVAPTRSEVDRIDGQLRLAETRVSLWAALRQESS